MHVVTTWFTRTQIQKYNKYERRRVHSMVGIGRVWKKKVKKRRRRFCSRNRSLENGNWREKQEKKKKIKMVLSDFVCRLVEHENDDDVPPAESA